MSEIAFAFQNSKPEDFFDTLLEPVDDKTNLARQCDVMIRRGEHFVQGSCSTTERNKHF